MAHPVFWPTKSFFYPIGNTSPVSLLQHVPPENDADILLLGCGDPRNLLYSLHASAIDLPSGKVGRKIDFTLCDIEPAILARNIFLFTLISEKGMGPGPSKLWNIFYHFYLDPPLLQLVQDHAQKLCDLSTDLDTWSASEYARFLEVGSSYTLTELHRIWSLYARTKAFDTSRVVQLTSQFGEEMKKIWSDKLTGSDLTASRSAGPLALHAMSTCVEATRAFWQNGLTFLNQRQHIFASPLFAYATEGEGFFAHYGTLPLSAFHLAPAFMDKQAKDNVPLREVYDVVQAQFRSWCDAFNVCVKSGAVKVKIRVLTGDALAMCQALHAKRMKQDPSILPRVAAWRNALTSLDGNGYSDGSAPLSFDVVDTSNLCDHLGIVNVLVATSPLLNRSPWATLFTETLLSSGEDAMVSINDRFCGDLTTMSLLFDLTPTSFIAGYNTVSNIHELVGYQLHDENGQYHERLTWKAPSKLSSLRGASPVTYDSAKLAALLYRIYHNMFINEDISGYLQKKPSAAHFRSLDLLHYTRKSFADLLAFLHMRIAVPWAEVMDKLVSAVFDDITLMQGMVHYQDFLTQLHLRGLHSEPNFTAGNALLTRNKNKSVLRAWDAVPPIVCCTFVVPRAKLSVIESPGAPPTPILQAQFANENAVNTFSYIETAFGSLSVDGTGEGAAGIIKEDPLGKLGRSAVVVSVCVPGWMVAEFSDDMTVRLIVASTPSTSDLISKLGIRLTLFEARLTDTRQVHFLNERPTVSRGIRVAIPYTPTPRPLGPSAVMTVGLENDRLATSMTRKITFSVTATQNALKEKQTPVTVEQVGPTEIKLSIGTVYSEVLPFPFAFDMDKHKLRVARQSSWIEVVVPPASLGRKDSSIKHRFPIVVHNGIPIPWNIHRLHLDRLPILAMSRVDRLEWVNTHVSLALSDRERTARENEAMDTMTQVKDSIHSIFVQAIGLQSPKKMEVFGLHRTSKGGIDTLLFIADMRLDVANHTIVADAFVLPIPVALMDKISSGFQTLFGKLCQVNLSDDECVAWKVLLPGLVERCRTWTHAPTCAYTTQHRVPLSTEHGATPICECGQGKVTDAFRRRKDWAPFLPYVTRVALSPLFAVSYLEPIASGLRDALRCAYCEVELTVENAMKCSKCKKAIYCDSECQVNDWKEHRSTCKK
ncbi:hypothetical protein PHLGIDRAFT_76054 [Phlebiopsis gigantea 11061_1 CR5-6]|uniref:MYND-type domain-containing protein n=1 Tax=Phlebiopsis gigantea (strain 11061_1 CR5-6) TaxID=745531 RepID=A0A0C3PFK7_PHLG1|nr:hypothetical protein PHLGIDRAFT_76054 [Phlebiopsis gigantea 11061_1 CR5-6]